MLACLCNLAWLTAGYAQATEPTVTILLYHRFSETADDSMTVRMTTFEAQLRILKERGYHIVSLSDAVKALHDLATTLPEKPVVITVDDGHRSVYEKLLSIVLRERFPVTLFIYPSAISNASMRSLGNSCARSGRPDGSTSSRIPTGIFRTEKCRACRAAEGASVSATG